MTGRVSWQPEAGTKGTHAVEVAVADSFGAESALRFELTVAAAAEEKKPTAPPAKAKAAADDGDDLGADDEEETDEDAEEGDALEE